MLRKTKHNSKTVFTLFIQNYKNNMISSLSYIHSFAELHDNSNLESFRELGYQLLNPKLCEVLYNEKNINILENFFLEIYEKAKIYIELKKYNEIKAIIYNLLWVLGYLPTLKEIDKIYSNINIHFIIIDTICLINNLNCFENKIKYTSFQRNGYLYELLDCEIYSIQIIILLCYLIDFDNVDSTKLIFNKIITKLFDYKKYKESLPDKIFSPHISLIRYYSIILNRFCFNYSLNNDCDLLDSFQYFQKLFPESKKLNLFLFKELITFFGFIVSQKHSFFIYYGEDMKLYYSNYFKRTLNYIFPDFSLMKYLLTLPEIQNVFNINNITNILNYSNIDNCNFFLMNFNQNDFSEKNEKLNEEIKNNEKNLKYFNSLLEFLLIILRDDLSMIKSIFKYTSYFKMNYKDKLFEKLLVKERKNLENLIRNEIIHNIVGNKNLVKRENCINIFNFYEHDEELNIDIINNILKENCEQISFSNQLKQYSLKKTNFSNFDIDYLINYTERGNAINYTNEFLSDNYNILNTYILKPLSIQEKINNRIYNAFFNNKNIDNFINFYKIIITNNYPLLTDAFLFVYSKILCVFIKFYNNDKDDELKKKLFNLINNNKLESKNVSYIQYIKKILSNEEMIDKCKENDLIFIEKQKNLKDKYKKKFNEKIKSLDKKYSSSEINFEKDNSILAISSKTEEICIYCRQYLDNNLNNYFGKICYLFRDFFIDILKNIDEKIRKKSTRFVTCNHNIHYDCYNKLVVNNYNDNVLKNGFPCMLCKKLSNIIIYDLINLKKNNENILKGLNYDNENYDEFYNKNILYPNLIFANKSSFESYCSKIMKKEILIKDINSDNNLLEQIYNLILNDFDSFIIYYNITNYKKEQINIWKNFLLTIRLLCKYKILNTDFFISKFKNINKKVQELNHSYLSDFEISSFINEFIVCLFILYDLNEDNKKKIKYLFQNKILIYIFVYKCLEKQENNFKDFLTKRENKDLIQKIFNFYNLKYKICFLLYDEKDEDLQLNYDINLINNNNNIQSLINNNQHLILKDQYLELPTFHIINLPENFIEFSSKYMHINCINCQKKEINYYLCLICGNKICNHINCVTEKKENGKKEYSLIEHSKICGGGISFFISGKTSEIVYLHKRQFNNSGIYVYLNSFGEYITNSELNNNYILNKIELNKSIQIFIDVAYRKKGFKVRSLID